MGTSDDDKALSAPLPSTPAGHPLRFAAPLAGWRARALSDVDDTALVAGARSTRQERWLQRAAPWAGVALAVPVTAWWDQLGPLLGFAAFVLATVVGTFGVSIAAMWRGAPYRVELTRRLGQEALPRSTDRALRLVASVDGPDVVVVFQGGVRPRGWRFRVELHLFAGTSPHGMVTAIRAPAYALTDEPPEEPEWARGRRELDAREACELLEQVRVVEDEGWRGAPSEDPDVLHGQVAIARGGNSVTTEMGGAPRDAAEHSVAALVDTLLGLVPLSAG